MSEPDEMFRGKVFKKQQGKYYVHMDGREVMCSTSTKLRRQLIYPTADPGSRRHRVDTTRAIRQVDPVAIGDEVAFVDASNGEGAIREVLPRRNKMSRRAPRGPVEQVVVANIDQVVPVFAAAMPMPKWGMLDRYLASAEEAGIPARIVITKMDLVADGAVQEAMQVYEKIGYPVHLTSAANGTGLESVKEMLHDRVSVLLGKSGVGKTTLLNAVQPDLGLRVNEVSGKWGKGKHTTTHLEMFALETGGWVVDTPGMREFGLWKRVGGAADPAELFPEMRPLLGSCRFGDDCSHRHEPGCAIKEAVEAGDIAGWRYRSLLGFR